MTPPTVKALVVRSPYAQEIADGTKTVEYRSWRTHYRGWLAIVAARRPESGADAGRVVCLARLAECVEAGPRDYEWVLADVRPVPAARPVLVPGRLGLYDLPADVAGAVWAELARVTSGGTSSTTPSAPRAWPRRELHRFLAHDDDPPGSTAA